MSDQVTLKDLKRVRKILSKPHKPKQLYFFVYPWMLEPLEKQGYIESRHHVPRIIGGARALIWTPTGFEFVGEDGYDIPSNNIEQGEI